MSNLYNITQNYLELLGRLENNEGVLEEGDEKFFDFVQEEFTEKAKEFCKIIKHLEGDSTVIDAEIARLQTLKANKESISERLEKSLTEALKLFGTKDKKKDIWRYEFDTFKISTRKSEVVEIIQEENVPNEYKKVAVKGTYTFEEFNKIKEILPEAEGTTTFNKTDIKKFLEGDEISKPTVEWADVNTKFGLSLK